MKKGDEDDLLRRAFAAYFRQPVEGQLDQPSNSSGVERHKGKDYVVLRNANGLLKVYRVRKDGMLKGLRRWPGTITGDY